MNRSPKIHLVCFYFCFQRVNGLDNRNYIQRLLDLCTDLVGSRIEAAAAAAICCCVVSEREVVWYCRRLPSKS